MTTEQLSLDRHIQHVFRLELQDASWRSFKYYEPLERTCDQLIGLCSVSSLLDDLRQLHIELRPWAVRPESDQPPTQRVWTHSSAPLDGRFLRFLFLSFGRNFCSPTGSRPKMDGPVLAAIQTVIVRHIGDAVANYGRFGSLADMTRDFVDIFRSEQMQNATGLLQSFVDALMADVVLFDGSELQPAGRDDCRSAYRAIMGGMLDEMLGLMEGSSLLTLPGWVMGTLVAMAKARGYRDSRWFAYIVLEYSAVTSGGAGKVYAGTLLGEMLRLSVVPKRGDGFAPLAESEDQRLPPAFSQHLDHCHTIIYALLRHCPDEILRWIGSCLERNAKVAIGSPIVPMLLSLASVLMRVFPARELLQTRDFRNLDPTYCSLHDPIECHIRSVRLGQLHLQLDQQPAPRFQYPDDFRFSNINELFYMCHRAIDLSFGRWWQRLRLEYPLPGRPDQLSVQRRFLVMAMLEHNELLQEFYGLSAHYVVHLLELPNDPADPVTGVPERFGCMPHFVINNISEFVVFTSRFGDDNPRQFDEPNMQQICRMHTSIVANAGSLEMWQLGVKMMESLVCFAKKVKLESTQWRWFLRNGRPLRSFMQILIGCDRQHGDALHRYRERFDGLLFVFIWSQEQMIELWRMAEERDDVLLDFMPLIIRDLAFYAEGFYCKDLSDTLRLLHLFALSVPSVLREPEIGQQIYTCLNKWQEQFISFGQISQICEYYKQINHESTICSFMHNLLACYFCLENRDVFQIETTDLRRSTWIALFKELVVYQYIKCDPATRPNSQQIENYRPQSWQQEAAPRLLDQLPSEHVQFLTMAWSGVGIDRLAAQLADVQLETTEETVGPASTLPAEELQVVRDQPVDDQFRIDASSAAEDQLPDTANVCLETVDEMLDNEQHSEEVKANECLETVYEMLDDEQHSDEDNTNESQETEEYVLVNEQHFDVADAGGNVEVAESAERPASTDTMYSSQEFEFIEFSELG